jgi:GT2 family glycosyltransferase
MNNNFSDINEFPSSAYLPACSVCVANYNGADVISACIDSIKNQRFEYPVEIIVHDDASTDNSVRIISEKYPEVILIESQENVGFCVSNNRMAAKSKGKYILLLNNDACLFPDALSKLYNYAESKNEAMILGLPQYDMETGELIDRGTLFDPFMNPVPNFDVKRENVGMVTGACLWLPRSLWEEIGGFPEWFHTLIEDMYLCCVARVYGYDVRVLPESGFRHYVGRILGGGKVRDGSLSTTFGRRRLSERNKSFVMVLCWPAPYIYLMLPVHILLLVSEGLLLASVKREWRLFRSIYWGSVLALWRSRRILFRTRRIIQNHSKVSASAFYRVFEWLPFKLRMLIRYGMPEIKN